MKKQYSNKLGNKHQARKPLITALEPRLLLDGAAVATAVDVISDAQLHHDAAQTDSNHTVTADRHKDTSKSLVIAPTEVRAVDPVQNNGRKEVVFIETNVADYQSLVEGTKAGVEVVLLDSSQDGLSQMTEWAKTHSDYDAIHVISHGSEGSVNLGALNLDRSDINGRASDLAQLGAALNEQGDLLLYGCDVASGEGQAFIDSIAQLTQADVAASNDLTGAADLHGDWDLEYHQGHIKEGAVWDKAILDHYHAILANSDFSGNDSDNSGGTGFKSLTNGHLVVDNGVTLDSGNMYLSDTADNDATITIKADGVDAASFDVSKVTVYKFGTAGDIVLDSSSTIVFKDKDGAVLRTMTLNNDISISSTPLNIFTLFDNDATTPVTGVAQIDFNFICNNASQVHLADLTFTSITYDNVVAPSSEPSGPSVPSTPDLSAASDTGISSTDNITNDTTPTFTVTGVTNGATVTLFNDANSNGTVDGGESLATGTASGTSIQLTSSALTSGTYNIKAIQNVGGTNSDATSAQSITIDTTAPTETIASATFSADTTANGGTNSDFITKTAEQTVSGTLSANLASGESVYVSLDNGTSWTVATASVGSNTWSLAGQTLEAGSNTLKVKVTDTAGNDGSIYSQNYVLDTTAPTITSITRQTPTGSSTNADSLVYQVAFSEAVSNLDASDFSVAGTTASVTSVSQVGSSNIYNITVSGGDLADLNGTVSLGFSGSQNIQDIAGNAITNTTPTGSNDAKYDVINSLTVTSGANTGDDATFSDYATDLTDGGGLSLAEAMHYASANQTVAFNLASDFVDMNGQTINLVSGVTLDTDSMNALTISNGTLNLQGSATVTNGVGDSLNVASIITGNGQTLTKTGEGRLTLSGTSNSSSSFSTHVTGGSLSISENDNLGSGGLTLDGSSLILQDSSDISHDITLGANGGTITVNNSDVTVSGAISGSGALTHTGGHALTLSGNNTFTGGFTLSGSGGVVVADGGNLGRGAVTLSQGLTVTGSSIALANNFVFNGGSVTNANNVTISGDISGSGSMEKAGAGTLNLSGAGNSWSGAATVSAGTLSGTTTSLTGDIVNNAAVVFNQNSSGTYSKIISGTGAFTKSGSGAVTLTGENTYTGNTIVSAGELVLNNSNGMALADTSAVALTGTGKLSLSSNETIGNLSGVSGTRVDLGANTLTVNQTNSSSFAGVMSGSGGLIKAGASTLTLSGSNTYTGGTTVSEGKLVVSGGHSISDASSVTVASGATFELDEVVSETVGSIAGAGSIVANGGTLTVGSNNTSTTFGGDFSAGSAGAALAKVGSGTLTLSGSNTYSGNTTVSGGTLSLTGSLINTSEVIVNSGATLAGSGSVFAANSTNTLTVNSGGFLAPGVSGVNSGAGELTVNGNLVLNGTLKADITGSTAKTEYDQVTVKGNVTLGANSAFDIAYSVTSSGNTFNLIDNQGSSAITGTLSGVAEGGTLTSNGRSFQTSYVGGTGNDITLEGQGNDNAAPVITSGSTGNVDENAPISTVIYMATATDAENDTLTYSLTGTDAALLDIDASTGAVTLKSSADYETKNTYSFNVVVTDSGTGHLTDTKAVTVSVNDLNDNVPTPPPVTPPVTPAGTPVISSGETASIDENAPANTVIYTATVENPDSVRWTYSLTGSDAALFNIDADTGEVTLKEAADYETKNVYRFNIVVTNADAGDLTASQAITVNVNDLSDNTPALSVGAQTDTLMEAGGVNDGTAGTNTAFITLTKTDADTGDTVSYDIDYLESNGWLSTDGGASYSKTGTYGTATITLATDTVAYVLSTDSRSTQALTAGQAVTDRFVIQVTDGSASQTADVVFNIVGANDAPIASGVVAPLTAISGQAFSPVTLPANLFKDLDSGETGKLVWRVENLPTGMVFNAETHTISGRPVGGFEGVNTLQIIAMDPHGAEVKVPVTLTISPAPVIEPVVLPIIPLPQAVPLDTAATSFDAPTTTPPLPSGTSSSDPGASAFAGAPDMTHADKNTLDNVNINVGNTVPNAIGTGQPAAVISTSRVAVNVGADGQVQVTPTSGVAANTTGLSIANLSTQPDRIFIAIADSGSASNYSATLSDGSALPSWVQIDPVTGEVTMVPPPGQGKISLKINAMDVNGNIRVLEVDLDLDKLPTSTRTMIDPVSTSSSAGEAQFMSLNDQLNIASDEFDEYGENLMKLLAS